MNNSNHIMLPEFIKNRIELKFGKPIRYPKDCEALAAAISNKVDEKISATTLMRLFGLIKNSPTTPRLFTLDLIAQYIGLNTWEEAINEESLADNSYFENIDKIIISSLKPSQIIHIKYSPDRELKLNYQGENFFKVSYSVKSKLVKDDVLKILRLDLTFPLVCENVIRNNKDMGKFVGGKEDGITHLKVEL